jgi:hypothetical protein
MRSSSFLAFLLGLAVKEAATAAVAIRSPAEIFKRWDHQICTCDLAGVAIPDNVNFVIPLENNRQNVCYDMRIGNQATATGQFCWNFQNYSLTLDFKPWSGYSLSEVGIWLGLSPPTGSTTSQYSVGNGYCTQAGSGDINCVIPWSTITGQTALLDVLHAMCPNGDREALIFYLNIIEYLTDSNGKTVTASPSPCDPSYSTCDPSIPYFELSYRCTACPTCPNVTEYCPFGTAFGYNAQSKALNTLSLNTCKRWGWYEDVPYASLPGITGSLYVGAGLNDISKATQVGTWSASVSGGTVAITYSLTSSYDVVEVHVDVRCSLPQTCAPGQYVYTNTAFSNNPATTTYTTPGIPIPCSSGDVYLIVHAKVNSAISIPATATSTFTCSSPVNTS